MFQSLYDRVLGWSRHRHAQRYLAGLSFAEATVFPIPPDVMLIPMVLADRDSAWRLATVTTLSSVLGGLFGYLIGWFGIETVLPVIERAGYIAGYDAAVGAFDRWGVWFVMLAGFTPIPFKVVTIAAGALGAPLAGFLVGAFVGRGGRFYLVSGIIFAGGRQVADHLRRWVDLVGWLMIAVIFLGGLLWWLV